MTDPISNFFAQIKNGYMASLKQIQTPYSRLKEDVAKVMSAEGYLGKVETKTAENGMKQLTVELLYVGKKAKLTGVKRVSKPGKRVYASKNEIGKVLGGIGCKIISTPKGIMTDKSARKAGIGGEILCSLW